MWHFKSIIGYYKVDFGDGSLGKNSVGHFVSKFYRIRVKKTRFRSKMDSTIWGRHLKSGFFFFWISSKTPAVDDDSCWSNNRNAPLMSTFLSFVLDLSNLWLHHLMASAVAVPISPEAAWCVCVIYPNQATHQAQAVLDHLSHLYPRPVGYPQRGKGVPFSEPSAKEEGGSSKIVSFTRWLEFNTETIVTPWDRWERCFLGHWRRKDQPVLRAFPCVSKSFLSCSIEH